ncbi:hypothetical protein AL536_15950 [Vibrio fluvialis]|uniref:Nitrate/nitrite sensing protein domain-containing protein n=1 Tax=Vibrio fluvialis TaxID=676 RepID=A0AAX2LRZ5_VIBFL|nr:hypothetical protein [Vibrio fluvialis]AMF94936.1 hypothetical protein AL536_15950 [Vibrio fluvialis]EKO4008104.1 hypothetical protein [Vibrio fluvialis]MBY8226981.1 hypothetical protein [Vibrio fluvialis]MCE7634645.1 hypothetical protein [Vibrio fluvialis]SUP26393.1 Uncharacterised protein [Vibrio fluvialis]
MFVFISMLISIGILCLMFFFAKQRESTLQRKYELLVDLRQLLYLCRQHRSATHHALMFGEHREAELSHLHDLIHEKSNHLIATAHFDNKPMYRILQLKLKALMKEWSDRSISRNQMVHGKAIRHCMFLMDEVMLAWLVESSREDLSDEYHMNWQQIIDTMDALTQLRICIEDMHTQDGRSRMQHYCDLVRRKLNQLALISPLSIASPACSKAMHLLSELHNNQAFDMDAEQLYQLTSDVSLSIAHVYDQMLADLTESLYLPLPKLVIA